MIARFFRPASRHGRRRPQYALPPGTRVYAVGDIHGRADLLARLHALIRRDAAASAAERNVLIHVGDYVDRGLQSRQVLEMLAGDAMPGFERVDLIGNHDAWMLRFLDDPAIAPAWLANGGLETLLSYGVGRAADAAPDERHARMSRDLAAALPAAHLDFLRNLQRTHREGDYVFVHAGIRPGVALDDQEPDDLLWIREPFLDDDRDHGLVVVHGHTIAERPEVFDNRIGIDTGAFATGRLTCLVLEGADHRFLQT